MVGAECNQLSGVAFSMHFDEDRFFKLQSLHPTPPILEEYHHVAGVVQSGRVKFSDCCTR